MNAPSSNFNMMIEDLTPGAGYERLLRCRDTATGLDALISIHSTKFGPAAGGCRMWDYDSVEDAIYDVERLSRGMTYKNVAANLPLGGGKSVIIGNSKTQKTPELMRAFGRFVDTLQGSYYTAEDVGISSADMEYAAEESKYVAGLKSGEFASGDPSPVTARGVFLCLKRAVEHKLGVRDLVGVRVAIQGLGHVGMPLAEMLHDARAVLIVTDTNEEVLKDAETRLEATRVGLGAIYDVEADVFAPCALGGVLTPEVIDRLKVKVIAGAANNQLATPDCGALLRDKGILYTPDYIVNGGGIVNVAMEILQISDPIYGETRIKGLVETMDIILNRADETGGPVNEIADTFVEERLRTEND
jgi:leucine dehydrogenase